MSDSCTVRIGRQAHRKLKVLAKSSGDSLTEALDKAIEAYRRERFLDEANAAYAALKKNKAGWRQEQTERREWDATMTDGLEDS